MAKFYGAIGYVQSQETDTGVWTEVPTERNYYGDITRYSKKWQSSEQLNDNLSLSNTISIIADGYAYENFFAIRYVKLDNVCWRVTSVEIQRPRLVLSLGDVYNGPKL